ncbi:FGGY-family carbohydrate kinase [Sphingomonas faeni]|uniref:FGGY-family carbohydrate kinase n=1 Tax=Sphingomonas faeni TaxID=185950 RepID=UPI002788168D|nr:FGGY family carbohydrate kinase [Sphingomonas faeni]MDQ0839930.1 glycerol kinase [Sphingomonas faeni]
MTMPVILTIDQGTTNTKALLVATDGTVMASRSRAMRVAYPRAGWAEQSASDIWAGVAALIAELVTDQRTSGPDLHIMGIGIANQRETVVIWDAQTGRALTPAVLWQCQRSAGRCTELRAQGLEPMIVERTGLGLDPLFPAAKIADLLKMIPGGPERAARGDVRCGTIDSWLLWNLTGGTVHATDHGNASRTQLFNLDTLDWDEDLATIFGVPIAMLPRVMASDSRFGTVAPELTALPPDTPIHAMMGDSHAALFAHGIETPGSGIKATIGTGSSLMTPTAVRVRSTHGLSSTIAWSRGGTVRHALEGNISVSGQAAAFATTLLGLADEAALTTLAASVPNANGVLFVPALAGLGAPHWCPHARGTISEMTHSTRPAHVARATLDAIALQIADVIEAMEADLGSRCTSISIDGGAAKNGLLAQILADLTGRNVARPKAAEASALGVARMAAEALGHVADGMRLMPHDAFVPIIADAERAAIRTGWIAAIDRAVR